MTRPNILLINDDGVHAPGLRALHDALEKDYSLTVVAPSLEKSGSGMSITYYAPLHVKKQDWGASVYSVSGTPADCVKIALTDLCEETPDLILSGINPGSNAGRNLFYSGTVGGVFEGALNGIPGAALSCLLAREGEAPDYAAATPFIPTLVEALLHHRFAEGTVLNVNFPVGPVKGIKIARQGKGYWRESPVQREHPEGHPYYWLGGVDASFDEDVRSDIALLKEGYAAAVPVNLAHLTCLDTYDNHRESFEAFFAKPLGETVSR